MSSSYTYPAPRRQVFSHRAGESGNNNTNNGGGITGNAASLEATAAGENGDGGSVSSAGTDRASNHNTNRDNSNHHAANALALSNCHSQHQHQHQPRGHPQPQPPLLSDSMLPVPTTVVAAIDGGNDGIGISGDALPAAMASRPVKLTAEALAKNNQALLANNATAAEGGAGGMFGVVEVSSNLSRSSSESGYLKNVYKGNSCSGNNHNNNGNASSKGGSSEAATPAHFQPFGEDVSSLGSLAEDVLLPTALVADPDALATSPTADGGRLLKNRELSEMALSDKMTAHPSSEVHPLSELSSVVHPTLSAETPPKDNLTSSFNHSSSSNAVAGGRIVVIPASPVDNRQPTPVELARLHPAHTPPRHAALLVDPSQLQPTENRLLPMGGGTAAGGVHKKQRSIVTVDSAIASIRPPPAPPLPRGGNNNAYSPYPVSPGKPPSAIRVSSGNNNAPTATYSPNAAHWNGAGGNSNGGSRRATFQDHPQIQQPAPLTRQSSNSSSCGTTHRIRLGICAMDKKARSKPMSEILKRLDGATFEPVFFGDDLILNDPVENWPICDVLIAFYSNGYPLEKAERYVALRQPYLLNDLRMQRTLMDRRRVYDLLEESGIDVPRHVFMSRDGYVSTGSGDGPKEQGEKGNSASMYAGCGHEEVEVDEHDDHIEVNGVVINKPFVEKPVDADDHNIAIYYPSSAGGGCKKLFRKVQDRSSEFYPEINDIRRDGSYIYEEFIETQGTDVKMYTVGPDYGHAEARKSPTVDGKVERNEDGKEVRFPVILTLREKEIARRIVLVFKQQVCGFDILRIQEGDSLVSYVCDVNGWSFVKNSRKYYDDCAQILTEHMLAALKPKSKVSFSALAPLLATMEDPVDGDVSAGKAKKKKKRHGRKKSIADRVKMMLMGDSNAEEGRIEAEENDRVSEASSHGNCSYGNSLGPGDTYEEPVDFTTNPVRNLPDQLATEPASSASIVPSGSSSLADLDDMSIKSKDGVTVATTTHQEELRCIITIIRHGDRTPKQKLKSNIDNPHILEYFHNHTKKVKKDLKIKAKKDMVAFLETVKAVISDLEAGDDAAGKNRHLLYKARHMRDILTRWKFSGLNRKLQMKPRKWNDDEGDRRCRELQLIVKWGGDLTKLGEKQAVRLGNRIRNELYPSNKDGGILRLHSTFRHDLKIKTSDEGRVMKTAAAFAKGMLELEGDIPPILVSLVHKEKDSRHMLDPSGNKEVKKDLDKCKEMVNINMQRDVDYDKMSKEERERLVGPERLTSLHRALQEIGNPRKTLIAIHSTIGQLVEQLDEMLGELLSGDEEVIEGGAGLKSRKDDDEALSGIKLYKGETLLELTERWKLLQNKLYNEEKDTFDLSRVPDVHDNVRFDMLHNPHLGLTETLQKLYDLAKSMADCVVPQEYGITIEEKRDIGSKMCHTLLEKINYDLAIARTDNQVDMRYLINMDYSADLPINSMGRRVRSRLYFTSESHLHSMLNVLRFPSIVPSPLSLNGQEILANASELCYLTQVVIRLFEDTQKPSDDPRRFRVEILFSPGATATPLHMAELYREKDATRFDTEKLQKISIDHLTCAQVEEYFAEAIKEGKTEDEDDDVKKTPAGKGDKGKKDAISKEKEIADGPSATKQMSDTEKNCHQVTKATDDGNNGKVESNTPGEREQCGSEVEVTKACDVDATVRSSGSSQADFDEKDVDNFWRSAAVVGVLLGVGCLFAMSRAAKSVLRPGR
mmetsp:Transcript_56610/g.120192  ORF Transcript_56610/g.120192 Transcript_56610/m.120192 type:complete len:1719 (+) Transcript_56610:117-5273(+)